MGLGWVVDILVTTAAGTKIVLEVDGPTHFAWTRGGSAEGLWGQGGRSHPLGRTVRACVCARVRAHVCQCVGMRVGGGGERERAPREPQHVRRCVPSVQRRGKERATNNTAHQLPPQAIRNASLVLLGHQLAVVKAGELDFIHRCENGTCWCGSGQSCVVTLPLPPSSHPQEGAVEAAAAREDPGRGGRQRQRQWRAGQPQGGGHHPCCQGQGLSQEEGRGGGAQQQGRKAACQRQPKGGEESQEVKAKAMSQPLGVPVAWGWLDGLTRTRLYALGGRIAMKQPVQHSLQHPLLAL